MSDMQSSSKSSSDRFHLIEMKKWKQESQTTHLDLAQL